MPLAHMPAVASVAPLQGQRWVLAGVAINLVLAAIKISVGVLGNSYALIADGFESLTDIASSLVVWSGLRVAATPPDGEHPYGHGKAESLAAAVVALALLGAAVAIAWHSLHEILVPHAVPAWYTLPVLLVVIFAKELLYRRLRYLGEAAGSTALASDAEHHRGDAITSLAALVGIAIALLGGPGWAAADDWAALLACLLIAANGGHLLQRALNELMDATLPEAELARLRVVAAAVPGIRRVEKLRARRAGNAIQMDIHLWVDPTATVADGHDLGHAVKRALLDAELGVADVVVHIEPDQPAPLSDRIPLS